MAFQLSEEQIKLLEEYIQDPKVRSKRINAKKNAFYASVWTQLRDDGIRSIKELLPICKRIIGFADKLSKKKHLPSPIDYTPDKLALRLSKSMDSKDKYERNRSQEDAAAKKNKRTSRVSQKETSSPAPSAPAVVDRPPHPAVLDFPPLPNNLPFFRALLQKEINERDSLAFLEEYYKNAGTDKDRHIESLILRLENMENNLV